LSARLIRPLDVIEVATLPVLIYGPPGLGKTSIAQTAEAPITLDFDKGIHRAANRRDAYQFDTWEDCLKSGEDGDFQAYKDLVIDTGGRALKVMIPEILRENPKNGSRGNLSPQGWGVLGSRFTNWMLTVRSWNKNVVMVCHQAEDRNASDLAYFKPEFPGKMAYTEIHQSFDMIGRVYHDGRKRLLDFSPRDNQVGKNAAGFDVIEVPDLHRHPTFLADVILKAKLAIGKTAEASAATAATVAHWTTWLAKDHDLHAFNLHLDDIGQLTNGVKRQVWTLVQRHAEKRGWKFDKKAKVFVDPKASTDSRESVEEEGVPA
jgi:hypothetical protein